MGRLAPHGFVQSLLCLRSELRNLPAPIIPTHQGGRGIIPPAAGGIFHLHNASYCKDSSEAGPFSSGRSGS